MVYSKQKRWKRRFKVYVVSGNSTFPKEIDLGNAYIKILGKLLSVNRSAVNRARGLNESIQLKSLIQQILLALYLMEEDMAMG